jgi:hypothetical protein
MPYYPPTVDVHRGDPRWDDEWITDLDAADQIGPTPLELSDRARTRAWDWLNSQNTEENE